MVQLCRYVREEGDESLEDWLQKEAQGTMPEGEYEVVAIVDERRCPHGGMSEFIVKWKVSCCYFLAAPLHHL